jgi:hypothetical protein
MTPLAQLESLAYPTTGTTPKHRRPTPRDSYAATAGLHMAGVVVHDWEPLGTVVLLLRRESLETPPVWCRMRRHRPRLLLGLESMETHPN